VTAITCLLAVTTHVPGDSTLQHRLACAQCYSLLTGESDYDSAIECIPYQTNSPCSFNCLRAQWCPRQQFRFDVSISQHPTDQRPRSVACRSGRITPFVADRQREVKIIELGPPHRHAAPRRRPATLLPALQPYIAHVRRASSGISCWHASRSDQHARRFGARRDAALARNKEAIKEAHEHRHTRHDGKATNEDLRNVPVRRLRESHESSLMATATRRTDVGKTWSAPVALTQVAATERRASCVECVACW
jgi:hypothetical protein